MVLLLPAPLGPSSAKVSPGLMSKLMSLTASNGPYDLLSRETRTAGGEVVMSPQSSLCRAGATPSRPTPPSTTRWIREL